MGFSETLNDYIDAAGCTLVDLSRESGLSAGTLSRYRTGNRVPDPFGSQIPAIAGALSRLAADGDMTLDEESVMRDLVLAAGGGPEVENANRLLEALGVGNSILARHIPFDASFISRVRGGKSRPADTQAYVEGVLHYIANHRSSPDDKKAVATLMESDASQLVDSRAYLAAMRAWAGDVHAGQADPVEGFLATLDAFDLGDYLRALHFDELKLPPQMPHMPTTRVYRGLAELRQGELDFFRSLVTSRKADTLFMCTDMPMEDMAEDLEFGKKWMIGVAATLKRGVHLNMIHNVDRPYREMMLGLESWIPLYMTGQISPFYLPGSRDGHYLHTLYASDSVVLFGEGVAGNHDSARYYVSRRKDDVAYGSDRAQQLLGRARPLMDIYRVESAHAYAAFIAKERQDTNPRRRMLPAPPLFALPEPILDAMLARVGIPAADAVRIRDHAAAERDAIEDFLVEGGSLADSVADVSASEFAARPVHLALSSIFYPIPLRYTWDEYREHVQAADDFAKGHDGYSFALDPGLPFRNMCITINAGKVAVISRGGDPCIHFVVRHPLLRNALENMVVAVSE